MEVKFEAETIMIAPSSSYAAQIMGKYGIKHFGLSAVKWQVMMNEKGVRDEVQQQMKRILYGN